MSFPFTNSKMYPANHKTIFVLDHTPYFGISCESPIEFDFLKSRTPNFIPLNPISKSLWTCSVESAVEYCRIVWDLFPQGKLIRFFASDTVAHIMNTWSHGQQNLAHVMNGMALIGIPPSPPQLRSAQPVQDFSVVHGLRAAIDALGECTDLQLEKRNAMSGSGEGLSKFSNQCRVICITSARDDDSMKRLQEIFNNCLRDHNKRAVGSDRLLTIDHCHLVIIHTFPVNIESQVTQQPAKSLSNLLTTEVHPIKAPLISNKLSTLILQHYDLASTIVAGIPMKEEQNASSSANYDVEIYHSREAHTAIIKGNSVDALGIRIIKEGMEYETVTLKWCTPRGCTASELQNCTSMYRITPVEVNSRPSLCLINFLLNGRSVMLEMPKKSGGKITSHLLASHGGEIFVHTLCTARSVLEDPPSISEGCGGRVTDYRITDFGLLIQQNRLLPAKSNHLPEQTFVSKMKARLNRHTKYWPLTISSTLIFNLKNCIDPLFTIITKEKITEEEVLQCKQVIFSLISMEAKHEPLHLPNTGHRSKGQKREDQYKIMWGELETFLKNNCHSENHKSVYGCLVECHKFSPEEIEKTELDQAFKKLVQMSKSGLEVQRASVIRTTTDSPMSPPPLTTIAASSAKNGTTNSATPKTLLDILRAQDKSKQRPDFAGRTADNSIAKLYPNLKTENDRGPKGEGMEVE